MTSASYSMQYWEANTKLQNLFTIGMAPNVPPKTTR